AIFFAGFGKGTGAAWFANLGLEEVDPSLASLRITRQPLVASVIDRKQYGQFIEYLCDVVPSMWAEKLCDGSFEGLTPYKVQYLKETDFREHPWYPSGATNRAEHQLDKNEPVSGLVAKRISVNEGGPCTVGISQDGIAIHPQESCIFTCFLKQRGV